MAAFDLTLPELERYRPYVDEPSDFDAFWQNTLTESRDRYAAPEFAEYESELVAVRVFDVTFHGYQGQPVKGWFLVPAAAPAPLPCVVEYLGYGSGRSLPTERLLWSVAGYAHFIMDNRGSPTAETPDVSDFVTRPHVPGVLTRGIEDPSTHYYRRLITDAVLAIDAVSMRPEVNAQRIAITGRSQGGGIALAVAALHTRPSTLLCDVPFLCHYRRATAITETAPYAEIIGFLAAHRDRVDDVYRVLSYFDGVNFAKRARARALFSVGLFDEVSPPSTVYAAYNSYGGPRDIRVYPYNRHEGGGAFHDREKLRFLKATSSM